ncbi:hypothetical protein OHA79_37860 [Streptomyces sp. NBC_00841]|uniref:hypothetical protein n=1 Tax=unclassified Streptomyces TaxID=2593676 RepID=UPI002250BC7D|nr:MULTISPECIES: hypothetical protein [unclassified Streptomyces]MCX4531319.1 hypothetical protein [Streptomyces sp. NBC_01669]WSA03099.1 hypothetical protein OHA79_37860 [Streptomyces sp. NBC_00841]
MRRSYPRGWHEAKPQDHQGELGLDTNELFTFIGETQIDESSDLADTYCRCDPNDAQRGFARTRASSPPTTAAPAAPHGG